jgi:hypothetical protein
VQNIIDVTLINALAEFFSKFEPENLQGLGEILCLQVIASKGISYDVAKSLFFATKMGQLEKELEKIGR